MTAENTNKQKQTMQTLFVIGHKYKAELKQYWVYCFRINKKVCLQRTSSVFSSFEVFCSTNRLENKQSYLDFISLSFMLTCLLVLLEFNQTLPIFQCYQLKTRQTSKSHRFAHFTPHISQCPSPEQTYTIHYSVSTPQRINYTTSLQSQTTWQNTFLVPISHLYSHTNCV